MTNDTERERVSAYIVAAGGDPTSKPDIAWACKKLGIAAPAPAAAAARRRTRAAIAQEGAMRRSSRYTGPRRPRSN